MNTQTQEVTGAVTTANALKMAIAALSEGAYGKEREKAIQACKAALATEQVRESSQVRQNDVQPAQEPSKLTFEQLHTPFGIYSTPVDTHPAPTKQWVGLSDGEVNALKLLQVSEAVIRAIEQELKTKNGFSDVKEKNHGN